MNPEASLATRLGRAWRNVRTLTERKIALSAWLLALLATLCPVTESIRADREFAVVKISRVWLWDRNPAHFNHGQRTVPGQQAIELLSIAGLAAGMIWIRRRR